MPAPSPYVVTVPIPHRQAEAVVGPFHTRAEAEAFRSMLGENGRDTSACRIGPMHHPEPVARAYAAPVPGGVMRSALAPVRDTDT